MITTIDTNILLDIFLPDPEFGESSFALLSRSYNQGALIVCEIVYAELVPQFKSRALLDRTLERAGISIIPIDRDIAFLAGKKWDLYRKAGGKRDRIITDFLVGAHAQLKSDQLLTRDRGFYRTYFEELSMPGIQ